jgi:predicted metal-dependent HD superfamily phosphohydrolase
VLPLSRASLFIRHFTIMGLISDELKEKLTALYNAKGRFYHTRQHVDFMLNLLEEHRSEIHDPDAVEVAIWYHDAIYDSQADDNEAESAKLAAKDLSSTVPAEQLERICMMIEATKSHSPPENNEPWVVEDTKMLLDFDLAIFTVDEKGFDRYETNVRKEYAWVPDDKFRVGRLNVLKSFLYRRWIYNSKAFRKDLDIEERARVNLRRSILRLENEIGASKSPKSVRFQDSAPEGGEDEKAVK